MKCISFIVCLLLLSAFLVIPLAPQATAMHEMIFESPEEQDAAVYPNPAQDFVFV